MENIASKFQPKPCSEDYIGPPENAESLRSTADFFDKSPMITTKVLAQYLGITDRRVIQLVEEGYLFKKERNKFNLYECIYNYINYQRRMVLKDLLKLKS